MKPTLILLLVIPLALLAQDMDCPVRITYSDWFFSPTSANASIGFPLDNKNASEDGYDRFCAYQTMRAKGVLYFYQRNGRLENREESLYFYYDPNSSGVSPNSLTPVDSFAVTSADKIYLYQTAESAEKVQGRQITLCETRPWISSNEKSGRIYGHGVIGLSYYDHIGSWVRSESDAVRDLLGKTVVAVGSEATSSGDWDMTEVFRYEYDLAVSGIRVERRWVDFEDWSCHVVVSAPHSEVKPWTVGLDSTLSDSVITAIDDTTSSVDSVQIDDIDSIVIDTSNSDTVTVETSSVDSNEKATFEVGSYQWNSLYYKVRRDRMNERMDEMVDEVDKKENSQTRGTVNKKGL